MDKILEIEMDLDLKFDEVKQRALNILSQCKGFEENNKVDDPDYFYIDYDLIINNNKYRVINEEGYYPQLIIGFEIGREELKYDNKKEIRTNKIKEIFGQRGIFFNFFIQYDLNGNYDNTNNIIDIQSSYLYDINEIDSFMKGVEEVLKRSIDNYTKIFLKSLDVNKKILKLRDEFYKYIEDLNEDIGDISNVDDLLKEYICQESNDQFIYLLTINN